MPLQQLKKMTWLHAPKDLVMYYLHSVKRHLVKYPVKAGIYIAEMVKLLQTGAVLC